MKKILITGASGQLGLKLKDHSVFYKDIDFIFSDIKDLDITDYNAVEEFFRISHIDLVINCAAYTAVDLAEKDSDKAYKINSDAPKHLAGISRLYGSKVIHISTDYVFDGSKNTPYSENDSPNPLSVYGKSKLNGENGVLKEDPEAIIIRTSWLYSEYGKNFAKTIINLAKNNESLKVVYDQTGTPTYAGSLAEALLLIAGSYLYNNSWVSGTYHYSNLGVCSWYDFAVYLLKYCRIKTKVDPVLSHEFKSSVDRPNYSVLDKSKLIDTYNIKIPYWTDACEQMLDIFLREQAFI